MITPSRLSRTVLRVESLDDRIAPAAGALDLTFGADGKLTTSLGTSDDVVEIVAIQTDGKIVVAGSSINGGINNFALARYNVDGSLDSSFDGDGKLTTSFGSSHCVAYGLAIQADGKIVAAGPTYNGSNYDIAVARYNADGSLDTSFDGDGKLTTAIGSSDDSVNSLAIQADGKIVVAGSSVNGGNEDFALVRYNVDGSLDTSFDGDGKLITDFGGSTDRAESMAIQTDGRIVVAGYSNQSSNYDFAVACYNADGSLDTAFDGDGKLTTAFGAADDFATSIAVQADGKIIAAGHFINASGNFDFALARYNTDGSFDTNFDNDGKLTTPIGSAHDQDYAVAIQSDGKIVAAGFSNNSGNVDFALVRYNVDGSLDTSFDVDGKLTTPIGLADDLAFSVAIQADGKIVAAGRSVNGSKSDLAIVRFRPDGSLDRLSDGTGKVITDFGFENELAASVAIQADGKLVVVGNAYKGGGNIDFAVARYNVDGSLDTTFGGTGKVSTAFGNFADSATGVFVQPDGKIVVAGFADIAGNNQDIALVRYNADGSLDSTFDGDGKVTTDLGSTNDIGSGVVMQPDGKFVVAGFARNATNRDFAVVRYNSDGTLDTTFDGDGKVMTPIGAADEFGESIALQPDGKIVVAGFVFNGANNDVAIVRYNSNGSLDTSFDGDGKVTRAFGSGDDIAFSVAVQPDGKILIGGRTHRETPLVSGPTSLVARFKTDGTLDPTFAGNGYITDFYDSDLESINAVTLQVDGKIIAVGDIGVDTQVGVARLTADGGFDSTFGDDGRIITDFGGIGDRGAAAKVQADGKIVVVGTTIISNYDFVVARYRGLERAPVPLPASFELDEDSSLSVNTADYFYDPDNDAVTTTLLTGPAHGTLTLNPYGQFTYTPFADFSGTDYFSYRADDSFGGTASGSVTLIVSPINDDPTANADVASLPEDSAPTAINVLNNDSSSPDANETLTITGVTQGASGSVAISGGGTGLTYQPNTNFTGADSFSYTISDGNGGTATATVIVAVTPVNDPPTANADSDRVIEDSVSNVIPVLANDTAAPDSGETLTIVAKTDGAHGSVAIVNGGRGLVYSPAPGYEGADSFTYTINDGTPGSDSTATVNIAVLPAGGGGGGNTAPTLSGVPVSANIDEGATFAFDASASDPDFGQELTFSLSGAPASAIIDPDTGEFSWATTETDGPNTIVFNVQVTDGFAVTEKTVTVIIRELNTAPVLSNVPSAVTIVRGNPFTFTATASDPDILNGVGNALTFSLVGAPIGAVIDPDTGVFTFLPNDIRPGDVISGSVRVVDDGVPAKSESKPIKFTMTAAAVLNGDLIIGGSSANDKIAVNPSKDLSQLVVVMNGATIGTFPAASVTGKIVARGLGGNDKITISPKVTKPTELWGGLGNDTMTGGAGPNVLIGGEGKDLLTGGIGRDVLLGGAGADKLVGGKGEDLLLGGVTDFEIDPTGLALIVTEWNSASLYADRVAHLTGTAGGVNGTAFLNASTVHNDGVKDVLTGGKDTDWFILSALDLSDAKIGETKTTII